jgi:hypothetical protein
VEAIFRGSHGTCTWSDIKSAPDSDGIAQVGTLFYSLGSAYLSTILKELILHCYPQ